MTTQALAPAGLPRLLSRPYKYLRLEWTSELGMLRVRTCVKPIQCYSLAGLTEMQRVLDDIALDKYTFIRDAYLQRRRSLVFDGNEPPPDNPLDAEPPASAPAAQ